MIKEKKFWRNTMSILPLKKDNLDIFKTDKFIIYRSVFEYINSNMYCIVEGGKACVIDPHKNKNTENILKDNDVDEIVILLTHEHPDHISGINWLQKEFKSKLICTKTCADYISQERNVRPILMNFYLEKQDKENGTNLLEKFNNEYEIHTYKADITFESEYEYDWLNHNFRFFNIFGHSKGSCAIIIDSEYVFTGDTLLKDFPVITRFPGGNTKIFKNTTIPLLEERLNPEMQVFPGHGNPFMLSEIMKGGKINVETK